MLLAQRSFASHPCVVFGARFIAGRTKQEVKARYLDKATKFRTLSAALTAAHKVFYPPKELAWQMIAEFCFVFNPLYDLHMLPDFEQLLLVVFSAPDGHGILSDCVNSSVELGTMCQWRLSR